MASVQGLECVCPVDAAPVYQFAESLKDQNKTFEDARGDLHNAHTTIPSSMTSRATDSIIDELDRQIARIAETVTHRQTLIDATMTFHDEIVTCKARQFHCESHWYRRWWCCRWNRRRINWVRPRAVGS